MVVDADRDFRRGTRRRATALNVGRDSTGQARGYVWGVRCAYTGGFAGEDHIVFGGHDAVGVVHSADDEFGFVGKDVAVAVAAAGAEENGVIGRDYFFFKCDEHGLGEAGASFSDKQGTRGGVFEEAEEKFFEGGAGFAGAGGTGEEDFLAAGIEEFAGGTEGTERRCCGTAGNRGLVEQVIR